MDLFLRRVIHPQAHDNYRVILKHDGTEFEIGSIGIQHGSGGSVFWAWGIRYYQRRDPGCGPPQIS
ncbi:MAG TPA: hypothetical protein VFB02_06860 [Bradyrhizobium sp.]|nr:hypothetical protein [Bradyrhizobium sp.]